MKNRAVLWVVVLPLVVFGSWLAKVTFDANSGKTVRLAIQGFDPRDLLSGHYLRYGVDWKGPTCESSGGYGERCVCLDGQDPARSSWSGTCDDRPDACDAYVRGTCNGGRFDANLERYYFPEAWRGKLITVPPNATVEVALTASGRAIVRQLLVDGNPLADWIDSRP